MGLGHSPSIIPDGLVFYFDPINTRSYAGTGLTGFNLINTAASGALVGGALYDIANKGSIYLDGVNDYINFTTQPISDNNSLSINCWVKFTTIPSTFTPIIDAGNVGGGTSGYCISFDNARKIYMAINSGFVNINYTFSTNTWYNITGTAQQGSPYSIKVYVNAVEAAIGSSGASNNLTNINSNLRIGSNFTGTITYLNANIGSLSVYNRALSSTEILQNYNVTKKRFSPEENIVKDGLVLNFDAGNPNSYAGVGNTAYDISGTGNTATLVNGVGFNNANNGSFLFDGTNDQISTSNIDLSATNKVTVSCWVKVLNYRETADSSNIVFEFSSNFNSFAGAFVAAFADGSAIYSSTYPIVLGIRGNSGYNLAGYSKTLVNDLSWHHWTCIFDTSLSGNENTLYIDGILRTSISTPLQADNSANFGNYKLFIGNRDTSTIAGNANIADLKLYNRVLTATEILQNYNALKGRYGLS